MKIADLKSGMLVKEGSKLLKISTVADTYLTAQVMLAGRPSAKPSRTLVRHYCAEDVELLFDPPTEGQLRRMDAAYAR